MNIFYLDDDPALAAQSLSDAHVRASLPIVGRLLASSWYVTERKAGAEWTKVDWEQPQGDELFESLDYLRAELVGVRVFPPPAYLEHHPLGVWARRYGGNYDWLYQHGMALLDEFKLRFDRIHFCTPVIRVMELCPPPLQDSKLVFCESPILVPPEFIVTDNAVESYRNYYKGAKQIDLTRYTNRPPPDFMAGLAHYKEPE